MSTRFSRARCDACDEITLHEYERCIHCRTPRTHDPVRHVWHNGSTYNGFRPTHLARKGRT